jgi:hypothetical protein
MSGLRLPDEAIALIARGVSCIVASRDAQLRPSVMRAVGSRISADGQEITVFLSRPQSRRLLDDLAAGGPVAAVFSQPTTHRTVQVKASRATQRGATPEDAADLERCAATLDGELTAIGYAAGLGRLMLAHKAEDVVAVTFRPEHAFDQTPGPQAGARLGSLR